jgi:hypothetical protein
MAMARNEVVRLLSDLIESHAEHSRFPLQRCGWKAFSRTRR